jgi:AmiR/NasT family two-component response regulator
MKPVIWIIDNQQWPRAYLRAELIERGFEAVGFIELAHALAALHHPYYTKPCLIVLELRGLSHKHDELHALAQIAIPIIALGGAVELNAEWAKQFEWAAVLQRPFTIGNVADLVEELVGGVISNG